MDSIQFRHLLHTVHSHKTTNRTKSTTTTMTQSTTTKHTIAKPPTYPLFSSEKLIEFVLCPELLPLFFCAIPEIITFNNIMKLDVYILLSHLNSLKKTTSLKRQTAAESIRWNDKIGTNEKAELFPTKNQREIIRRRRRNRMQRTKMKIRINR